jgi:non-canonical purine NTP pyrophosphatase (RdgB/HAM1 family)
MRGRPPELVLATRNPGKVRELEQMTEHLGWIWRSLVDFPEVPEAPEDCPTIPENARAKAIYYSLQTARPALADDSGLEVDALHGAPGVHSAYYAGHPRDDAANNRKLIADLTALEGGAPPDGWPARFRCCLAFAVDGQIVLESAGTLEGRIVATPRGTNGFGYDPHFWLPEQDKCLAELTSAEKNAISHRGQATRVMVIRLQQHFAQAGRPAGWYRPGP